MNKISKIAAVALVALGTAFSGSAQNMTVTTRDGQKHKFKTADVEHVTFDGTTLEQGPFEVTVSEITSASAKLEVIPENKSLTYYFDVCMKSDYERTTVKRIVENYFVQMQESYPQLDLETILEATLSRGDDSDVVKGLPSDCEMVCYAIGVDANGLCVGEPTVVPFRTLPPGKPEDCTFEISYSDLDAESLTVIVKPSDPAISYWMGVAGVFDYPGDAEMTNLVKRTLEQYCEAYGRDMNEIVQGVTFKGDLSIIESGLEANRPYYIYVYAMDENGDAAGLVHKLQFVTADNVWSEADVEATWRWYDGNALAEAYPNGEYDKAKGGVLLQPVFTPNEKAAVYYWALGVGDMTDKSTYPDETTKYFGPGLWLHQCAYQEHAGTLWRLHTHLLRQRRVWSGRRAAPFADTCDSRGLLTRRVIQRNRHREPAARGSQADEGQEDQTGRPEHQHPQAHEQAQRRARPHARA